MVFAPKGAFQVRSRTSAFGLYNKPKKILTTAVRNALGGIKHERCLADKSATRVLPVKRLRNNLIDAMSLNVATQPVMVVSKEESFVHGVKHTKRVLKPNPIWAVAPQGAYYKSKKICSLVTDIVTISSTTTKISRDLERLSIHIWNMSKRHFDGIVRRIRARVGITAESVKFRKSPEAVKGFGTLITNPRLTDVVKYRFSRNRICPHKRGCTAMRLSNKLDLAILSHKCRKCTDLACAKDG